MTTLEIVLGVILLVGAVFLVIAVLMQQGKSKNLSGAIAGGADTFFGKAKGKTIDKVLAKVTSAVAVVFVLIVVAMYAIQPDINFNASVDFGLSGAEGYEGVETTAESTVETPVTDEAAE